MEFRCAGRHRQGTQCGIHHQRRSTGHDDAPGALSRRGGFAIIFEIATADRGQQLSVLLIPLADPSEITLEVLPVDRMSLFGFFAATHRYRRRRRIAL